VPYLSSHQFSGLNKVIDTLSERHGLRPDQIGIHGSFGGSPESIRQHGILARTERSANGEESQLSFTANAAHGMDAIEMADHYATSRPGSHASEMEISKDNPRTMSGARSVNRGRHRGTLAFVDLTKAPEYRSWGGGAELQHAGPIPPEAIIHVQHHARRAQEPSSRGAVPLTDPREKRTRLRAFYKKTGRPVPPLGSTGAFGGRL
jgi:hypothetical protein